MSVEEEQKTIHDIVRRVHVVGNESDAVLRHLYFNACCELSKFIKTEAVHAAGDVFMAAIAADDAIAMFPQDADICALADGILRSSSSTHVPWRVRCKRHIACSNCR